MMSPISNLRARSWRDGVFAASILLTSLIALRPLAQLCNSALQHAHNSHILLVLPVVVGLLVLDRKGHDAKPQWAIGSGALVLLAAVVLAGVTLVYATALRESTILSLSILSLVISWLGLVVLFYGIVFFRQSAFTLFFLLLLVPLPDVLLNQVTYALQCGSTYTTHALFVLFGIPVSRNGFVLSLPAIDIEVAAECSGIRSSMMLFLTTLVLGHLFLRTVWRQSVLLLSVVVITIVKNALRIFVLSTLAIYVDPVWLEGDLHHRYGGSIFFALAVGLIYLVLRVLQHSEQKRGPLAGGATSFPSPDLT
jgi:exosortase